VVNAGENLKTLPEKQEWNNQLAKHLATCNARKPTIWTGDLNVVLDARDLSNASKKWQKSAGYTSIECDHHRRVLDGTAYPGAQPYVDIWRERHPDAVGHYSESVGVGQDGADCTIANRSNPQPTMDSEASVDQKGSAGD
jgi:AP endonuclease-1